MTTRRNFGALIALGLMAVAGGVSGGLFALQKQLMSNDIPGANRIDSEWAFFGLYSVGNPAAGIDRRTLERVVEVMGSPSSVYWAEGAAKVAASSQEHELGVHFVSRTFFSDTGVQVRGRLSDLSLQERGSAILSRSGALALGISLEMLPLHIKVNDRPYLAQGIADDFFGLPASRSADVFLSEQELAPVLRRGMSEEKANDVPVFRLAANIGGRSLSDIEKELNARVAPQSQFFVGAKDLIFKAHQGPFVSAANATRARNASEVLSSIAMWILVSAFLSYLGLRLASENNFAGDASIRSAMGERMTHRLAICLKDVIASVGFLSVIAVPTALVAVYTVTNNSFLGASSSLLVPNVATIAIYAFATILVPGLSFPALRLVLLSISLKESTVRNVRSPIVGPIRPVLAAVGCVSLLAVANAIAFSFGMMALQDRKIGFNPLGLTGGFYSRVPGVAIRTDGAPEALAAISRAKELGGQLGFSSCVPFKADSAVSFADIFPGTTAAIAICHASPSIFETLGITFTSGSAFEAGDRQGMVVTQSFLALYDDDIGLGSRVLEYALGEPHSISGVVEDVQFSGPNRPFPPTVFINGLHFGAANGFVLRSDANRAQFISYDLEKSFGLVVSGHNLFNLQGELASQLGYERFQRFAAVFGALSCLVLSLTSLAAGVALFLRGARKEIALRIALGARFRHVFATAVKFSVLPVFGGTVMGGLILQRYLMDVAVIVPVSSEFLVGSLAFILVVSCAIFVCCSLAFRAWARISPSEALAY